MRHAREGLGPDDLLLLEIDPGLVPELDEIPRQHRLEREVGRRIGLEGEILVKSDLAHGREVDRLQQHRKHRQRKIDPDLAEAVEERGFAPAEQLHAAGEPAFLQGK